jgi:hypothetical protein
VHTFVSVQSVVAKQQSRIAVCVQPTPSVQTSVVQASLSVQFGGVSVSQTPAWQVAGLQVVPHGVPLRGVVGPHRFAAHVPLFVHGLLSMSVQSSFVWQQFGFDTWTQRPSWHALSVHSEPAPASSGQVEASAQAWQFGIGVDEQPPPALQESVVHGSLSLHVTSTWVQVLLALQPSVVQASLSLHCAGLVQQPAVPLFTHWPVAGTQLSIVQESLSLQSIGADGCWQTPLPSQVRTPLQRSPSSQLAPVSATTPQTPALHVRSVHGLPSSGQSVGFMHCAGA